MSQERERDDADARAFYRALRCHVCGAVDKKKWLDDDGVVRCNPCHSDRATRQGDNFYTWVILENKLTIQGPVAEAKKTKRKE